MHTGFTTLDYSILIIYLFLTLGIGFYFTRKQKSLEDYFVAARNAPWWAVGISIIATDLSAISYLGAPGYVFGKDLQMGMGILLFPFIMILVVYLFVPFLARLRLFTVYEYLGKRFSVSVRLLASALFLLIRGGWLATAIYAQGLALSVITGIDLFWAVILISGMTGIYTVLGGMEAVLWTDVMQFFVLVGGIGIMIGAVLVSFHGNVGQIWQIASDAGHTKMFTGGFSWTEITVWGLIGFNVITVLNSYGSDQLIVQRYLTAGNKKAMTGAVMFNGIVTLPVTLALSLLGVGLFAYYQTHPILAQTLAEADKVVPHFITNALKPGLSGIVVAGIFAATMSSLSAGFNSLSTATIIDFYKRINPGVSDTDAHSVKAARWCTLFWAIFGTIAALNVEHLGKITEIMGKINGFIAGPLIAIFLLGVLTKRTNTVGVLSGAIIGTIITAVTAKYHMSWIWYAPVGCGATMLLGYLISFLGKAPAADDINGLTLATYKSKDESDALEAKNATERLVPVDEPEA